MQQSSNVSKILKILKNSENETNHRADLRITYVHHDLTYLFKTDQDLSFLFHLIFYPWFFLSLSLFFLPKFCQGKGWLMLFPSKDCNVSEFFSISFIQWPLDNWTKWCRIVPCHQSVSKGLLSSLCDLNYRILSSLRLFIHLFARINIICQFYSIQMWTYIIGNRYFQNVDQCYMILYSLLYYAYVEDESEEQWDRIINCLIFV